MTIFERISVRIIKEQELIIGPLAWSEAKKVSGLNIIDQTKGEISITAEAKETLNALVAQYTRLFGRVSVEVCKEATKDLLVELPKNEVPESLQ